MSGGAHDLRGQHALVAGAGEPIGRAVAVGLAAAGADVSVTTRRDDPAEEVTANSILNECWSYGRSGRALRLDLGDLDAVSAALEPLEEELAPLDLLVNLAFDPPPAPGSATTLEDWTAAIAAGATPAFVLARALGSRMFARRSGLIVSVVPPAGDGAGQAPLRAARAAVVGLSEGLAAEWGAAGVAISWLEEAPPEELRERVLQRVVSAVGGGADAAEGSG